MGIVRQKFHPKRGWYQEVKEPADLHYVQGDEIVITSNANGKVYTSKAKYIQEHERMGFSVGDKNSKKSDPSKDMPPIDQDKLHDGFEYALAVASDPTRLNEWRNEQQAKIDELNRLTTHAPDAAKINAELREQQKEYMRARQLYKNPGRVYFT